MKDSVTILGQEYELVQTTPKNDPKLENNFGYLEPYSKKIVIDKTIAETIGCESGRADCVECVDNFINKIISISLRNNKIHKNISTDRYILDIFFIFARIFKTYRLCIGHSN